MAYKDKEEQRKHAAEYMRAYRKRVKENNGGTGGLRKKGNATTPYGIVRAGYFKSWLNELGR